MRFCLNCGNPVGGSPWYCAGCGAPINPGPVRDVFAAQHAGPGQPGPLQADQDPPGYPGPVGWPDPWTPGNPALPAAVAAPGTGSAAPVWFGQPPPAGHPQAGGPAGAPTPASGPPRAAAPATRRGRLSSGHAMTITATLTGLIVTGPAGLAARVTFTSHQKPAASPDHAACDHWDITLFVRHRAGRYQIRRPQPGFPQSVRACS